MPIPDTSALDPNRPGVPDLVLRHRGGIVAEVAVWGDAHVLHISSPDGTMRLSAAMKGADALGVSAILGRAAAGSAR